MEFEERGCGFYSSFSFIVRFSFKSKLKLWNIIKLVIMINIRMGKMWGIIMKRSIEMMKRIKNFGVGNGS